MNQRNPFKTYIAALTVFAFFFTNLGITPDALAAASMPTPRNISGNQAEVLLPYQARLDSSIGFSIPSELGSIEYFRPGKGPALIHIQTAHGHYQAQKQIQQILHHLDKNYGVKTLFLEGSGFELNPELIRFFPDDHALTMKAADELTKRALLKGPELFLLDKLFESSQTIKQKTTDHRPQTTAKDFGLQSPVSSLQSSEGVRAYGIEELKSYRENGVDFVNVLEAKQKTQNFLADMDMGIERLSSHYLNKDLRGFLKRLEAFEKNQIPFEDWLTYLKGEAAKRLEMDLGQAQYQIDWPMMVRIFKVRELSGKLNKQAFPKEREKFLSVIKRFLTSTDHSPQSADKKPWTVDRGLSTYAQVEALLKSETQSVQLPDPETSLLFEDMVRQLPEDFDYEKYPNVRYFIGMLLLQSELKAQMLMEEMDRLVEKISVKLADAPEEQKLLVLLKDYRLLQKLFALELLPKDYEAIIGTRDLHLGTRLKPSNICARFNEIGKWQAGNEKTRNSNEPLVPSDESRVRRVEFKHVEDLDVLFNKALAFYAGVKERDLKMETRIEERLKETGAQKAVVITGGFHSQPFRDHFTNKDFSYALIAPKLTSTDAKGREEYIQNAIRFTLKSTRESSPLAHTRVELAQNGVNVPKLRAEVRQVISKIRSDLNTKSGEVATHAEIRRRISEQNKESNQSAQFRTRASASMLKNVAKYSGIINSINEIRFLGEGLIFAGILFGGIFYLFKHEAESAAIILGFLSAGIGVFSVIAPVWILWNIFSLIRNVPLFVRFFQVDRHLAELESSKGDIASYLMDFLSDKNPIIKKAAAGTLLQINDDRLVSLRKYFQLLTSYGWVAEYGMYSGDYATNILDQENLNYVKAALAENKQIQVEYDESPKVSVDIYEEDWLGQKYDRPTRRVFKKSSLVVRIINPDEKNQTDLSVERFVINLLDKAEYGTKDITIEKIESGEWTVAFILKEGRVVGEEILFPKGRPLSSISTLLRDAGYADNKQILDSIEFRRSEVRETALDEPAREAEAKSRDLVAAKKLVDKAFRQAAKEAGLTHDPRVDDNEARHLADWLVATPKDFTFSQILQDARDWFTGNDRKQKLESISVPTLDVLATAIPQDAGKGSEAVSQSRATDLQKEPEGMTALDILKGIGFVLGVNAAYLGVILIIATIPTVIVLTSAAALGGYLAFQVFLWARETYQKISEGIRSLPQNIADKKQSLSLMLKTWSQIFKHFSAETSGKFNYDEFAEQVHKEKIRIGQQITVYPKKGDLISGRFHYLNNATGYLSVSSVSTASEQIISQIHKDDVAFIDVPRDTARSETRSAVNEGAMHEAARNMGYQDLKEIAVSHGENTIPNIDEFLAYLNTFETDQTQAREEWFVKWIMESRIIEKLKQFIGEHVAKGDAKAFAKAEAAFQALQKINATGQRILAKANQTAQTIRTLQDLHAMLSEVKTAISEVKASYHLEKEAGRRESRSEARSVISAQEIFNTLKDLVTNKRELFLKMPFDSRRLIARLILAYEEQGGRFTREEVGLANYVFFNEIKKRELKAGAKELGYLQDLIEATEGLKIQAKVRKIREDLEAGREPLILGVQKVQRLNQKRMSEKALALINSLRIIGERASTDLINESLLNEKLLLRSIRPDRFEEQGEFRSEMRVKRTEMIRDVLFRVGIAVPVVAIAGGFVYLAITHTAPVFLFQASLTLLITMGFIALATTWLNHLFDLIHQKFPSENRRLSTPEVWLMKTFGIKPDFGRLGGLVGLILRPLTPPASVQSPRPAERPLGETMGVWPSNEEKPRFENHDFSKRALPIILAGAFGATAASAQQIQITYPPMDPPYGANMTLTHTNKVAPQDVWVTAFAYWKTSLVESTAIVTTKVYDALFKTNDPFTTVYSIKPAIFSNASPVFFYGDKSETPVVSGGSLPSTETNVLPKNPSAADLLKLRTDFERKQKVKAKALEKNRSELRGKFAKSIILGIIALAAGCATAPAPYGYRPAVPYGYPYSITPSWKPPVPKRINIPKAPPMPPAGINIRPRSEIRTTVRIEVPEDVPPEKTIARFVLDQLGKPLNESGDQVTLVDILQGKAILTIFTNTGEFIFDPRAQSLSAFNQPAGEALAIEFQFRSELRNFHVQEVRLDVGDPNKLSVEEREEAIAKKIKDGKTRIYLGTSIENDRLQWDMDRDISAAHGLVRDARVLAVSLQKIGIPVHMEFLKLPLEVRNDGTWSFIEYDYYFAVGEDHAEILKRFILRLRALANASTLGDQGYVRLPEGILTDEIERFTEEYIGRSETRALPSVEKLIGKIEAALKAFAILSKTIDKGVINMWAKGLYKNMEPWVREAYDDLVKLIGEKAQKSDEQGVRDAINQVEKIFLAERRFLKAIFDSVPEEEVWLFTEFIALIWDEHSDISNALADASMKFEKNNSAFSLELSNKADDTRPSLSDAQDANDGPAPASAEPSTAPRSEARNSIIVPMPTPLPPNFTLSTFILNAMKEHNIRMQDESGDFLFEIFVNKKDGERALYTEFIKERLYDTDESLAVSNIQSIEFVVRQKSPISPELAEKFSTVERKSIEEFSEKDQKLLEQVFRAWGIDIQIAGANLAKQIKSLADRIYVAKMTLKHRAFRTKTQEEDSHSSKAPLKVRKEKGSLGEVSDKGNAVITALLSDKEKEELGVFKRESLDAADPAKVRQWLEAASRTHLTWNTLDGGIGESLMREKWLENKAIRSLLKDILALPSNSDSKYSNLLKELKTAETNGDTDAILTKLREILKLAERTLLKIKMGAKGTDLGRIEKIRGGEYLVGDAEIRLLFMIDLAAGKKFGKIAFQPLVNYQSRESYKKLMEERRYLWDVISGVEQPRTYAKALEEAGVDVLEPLEQKDLPKFEVEPGETQGFPTLDSKDKNKGQPGGHGQWGVYYMIDFSENAPPADGLHHVRFFGNGDNRKGNPEPIVAGFIVENKIPILKIVTPATPIDKKGGKEVIRIIKMNINGQPKIFNVLDQWEEIDAKMAKQALLFYAAGQRNGFGEEGKQLFNTNLFYFNIDLLHAILEEIRGIVGPDTFLDAIMPVLFDKSDKAIEIEGKKYVSMDSAIGYVIHNLNTFYSTDPRLESLRKKYGKQLLFYMEYDRNIFAPKKKAEDQFLQESTDYYSEFDESIKNFRDAENGLTPPDFSITDPTIKWNPDKQKYEPVDNKYWNEAQHWLDSFGFAHVRRMKSLKVQGRVTVRNAEFIGDVVIRNHFKQADLQKPATRVVLSNGPYLEQLKKLGFWTGDHLRLENVMIKISENGTLTTQPVLPDGAIAIRSTPEAVDEFRRLQAQGASITTSQGFEISNGGELIVVPEDFHEGVNLFFGNNVKITGIKVKLRLLAKSHEVIINGDTVLEGPKGLELDLVLKEGEIIGKEGKINDEWLHISPMVLQGIIGYLSEGNVQAVLGTYQAHLDRGEKNKAFFIRKLVDSLVSSPLEGTALRENAGIAQREIKIIEDKRHGIRSEMRAQQEEVPAEVARLIDGEIVPKLEKQAGVVEQFKSGETNIAEFAASLEKPHLQKMATEIYQKISNAIPQGSSVSAQSLFSFFYSARSEDEHHRAALYAANLAEDNDLLEILNSERRILSQEPINSTILARKEFAEANAKKLFLLFSHNAKGESIASAIYRVLQRYEMITPVNVSARDVEIVVLANLLRNMLTPQQLEKVTWDTLMEEAGALFNEIQRVTFNWSDLSAEAKRSEVRDTAYETIDQGMKELIRTVRLTEAIATFQETESILKTISEMKRLLLKMRDRKSISAELKLHSPEETAGLMAASLAVIASMEQQFAIGQLINSWNVSNKTKENAIWFKPISLMPGVRQYISGVLGSTSKLTENFPEKIRLSFDSEKAVHSAYRKIVEWGIAAPLSLQENKNIVNVEPLASSFLSDQYLPTISQEGFIEALNEKLASPPLKSYRDGVLKLWVRTPTAEQPYAFEVLTLPMSSVADGETKDQEISFTKFMWEALQQLRAKQSAIEGPDELLAHLMRVGIVYAGRSESRALETEQEISENVGSGAASEAASAKTQWIGGEAASMLPKIQNSLYPSYSEVQTDVMVIRQLYQEEYLYEKIVRYFRSGIIPLKLWSALRKAGALGRTVIERITGISFADAAKTGSAVREATLADLPKSFKEYHRFNLAQGVLLSMDKGKIADGLIFSRKFAFSRGAIAAARTVLGDVPLAMVKAGMSAKEIQFVENLNLQFKKAGRKQAEIFLAETPEQALQYLRANKATRLRALFDESEENDSLAIALKNQLPDIQFVSNAEFQSFLGYAGTEIQKLVANVQGQFAIRRAA